MSGKEIVARGKSGKLYANKKYMGVHIQDCLETTDINIAREVLRDLMAEVRAGRYQLWKQFFSDWVPRYEVRLEHFSVTKRERAIGIIEKHLKPFFKNRRMGDVLTLDDPNDPDFIPLVVRYKLHREALGAAESTLRKELQVIRDIIRMVDKAFPFPTARTEPLMKMKNKGKVKTDALDHGQVLALAETVYCKYRLPWLMSCYTGLDLKDACGLVVGDFREPGWIKDSRCKTANPFHVPIHSVLQEQVLDHIPALASRKGKVVSLKVDPDEPLFSEICPRAMANAVIRAASKLGYRDGNEESRVSSKWGRHFYATTLAEVEDDEKLIAVALGHKRKSITRLYIHRNKPRLFVLAEQAFSGLARCANGVQLEGKVKQSGSK